MKPVILFHAECNDGYAAAWVARRALLDADFIPVKYNQPPPPLSKPRDILILDFSYPRQVLVEMASRNHSVTVLDHHKTAAMDLALLPPVPSREQWQEQRDGKTTFPLTARFDMARSGAGLTWDWFHPGVPRPPLVDYIEDRDLWRFQDPDTRAIHSMLSAYEYDFDVWTDLAKQMEDPDTLTELIGYGHLLDQKHLKLCKEIIAQSRRMLTIAGHYVPVCAAPYAFASDIGNMMCKGHHFAATYVDHAGGRTWSLRSWDQGEDVSAIAKLFGGGGHRNAAGFTLEHRNEISLAPEGLTRPA